MKSLAHFLQARIQEDEAAAHADRRPGAWSTERILSECAAKRAVLTALERDRKAKAEDDAWDWLDEDSALDWLFGESKEAESKKLAREILRALAQPYTDHPDYRREWLAGARRTHRFW